MTVHRRNSPESRTPLKPEVIATIRQAAIDGKTIKQAAALVGISYIRVYNIARKLDLPFKRQSRFFGREVSEPPVMSPAEAEAALRTHYTGLKKQLSRW